MEKRALLIGINKYPHMSEKGQLKGCVNDVTSIAEILENQFGFGRNKITILRDEEATRDGIVMQLRKLASECGPDDAIVFHFSGHGSRRLSRIPGKPDGLEETIVPYDSGRKNHPNRDISDENLKSWISHLAKKTSNITLFFDNCYSGSIVRGEGAEQIRLIQEDERVFVPSKELLAVDIFSPAMEDLSLLPNYYSLITACDKGEYAREHTVSEEVRHGAFTYNLVRAMENLSETATYDDLFETVNLKITTLFTLQHPQLQGVGNRLIFSGVERPEMRYVSVENREGSKVTLFAGAINGLTKKSKWAIYPASSSEFSPEERLGMVRITEVGGTVSKAVIVSENVSQAIKAGCRAAEETHFYETPSVSVDIESDGAGLEFLKKEILDGLKASPWLKAAGKKRQKDIAIELTQSSAGRIKINALNKKDDGLLFKAVLDAEEAASKVLDYLEKLCRYRTILELQNPFSPLKGIKFNLLQKTGNKWHRAKPVLDGLPIYTEGEEIGFEIINKSFESIFVGVLDLGLTKRISLLYPFRAASEEMGFKRGGSDKLINSKTGTLVVGKIPADRIKLRIPKEAQIELIPRLKRRGGKEIFKLMVALRQTNFRVVEQSGIVRNRNSSSLENLIFEAFNGTAVREAERDDNQLNTWLTIDRGFYLCKR